MTNVKVIYGSTTGNTEEVAKVLAIEFDADVISIENATIKDFEAELIIIGCSTWGIGELQDDWDQGMALLENFDFCGKTVALFGFGDGSCFGDTFVDALGTLYNCVTKNGARVIGFCDTASYDFSDSTAIREERFVGLPLDEENQHDLSVSRISEWVAQLKREL